MRLGIGVTNFSWSVPTSEIGPTVTRIARLSTELGSTACGPWTTSFRFAPAVSHPKHQCWRRTQHWRSSLDRPGGSVWAPW